MKLPVVDVIAGHPHFVEHTVPVYRALPPEMRGGYFTTKKLDPGLKLQRSDRAGRGDLTLVCSYGDLMTATFADDRRPVVFMEHGAGFTFEGSDGRTLSSYAGSLDRPNVILFLCQNEIVQRLNTQAHPHTASALVGSPKMDRWVNTPKPQNERPIVGISFHWKCIVAPGTWSAFDHYQHAIAGLLDQGWDVRATAHPRMREEVQFLSMALGIPYITLDEMYRTADLLIADATSAMYEFASLDRPVLTLNCPRYRAEADDGIRFWQHIPGLMIDEPNELVDAAHTALQDAPEYAAMRRSAVDAVYPLRGHASDLAAYNIGQLRHGAAPDDSKQVGLYTRLTETMHGRKGSQLLEPDYLEELHDVTQP